MFHMRTVLSCENIFRVPSISCMNVVHTYVMSSLHALYMSHVQFVYMSFVETNHLP